MSLVMKRATVRFRQAAPPRVVLAPPLILGRLGPASSGVGLGVAMRGRLRAVVILVLCLPMIPAVAVGNDAYDPNRVPITADQMMMTIEDPAKVVAQSGLAVKVQSSGAAFQAGWSHCRTPDEAKCDPATVTSDLNAESILPHCSVALGEYCVESLELAPEGGVFAPARFIRNARSDWSFAPQASSSLVEGSGAALFEGSNIPAGAPVNYAVSVLVTQSLDLATRKFNVVSVTVNVLPYRDGESRNTGGTYSCVFVEDGRCAIMQAFQPGTSVRVGLRIPSSVGGWFRGHIKDPNVDVQAVSAHINRLTVSGEAVVVPRFAVIRSKSDYSADRYYLDNFGGWWGTPAGVAAGALGEGAGGFTYLDHYRDLAGDTAGGETSFWNLKTVPAGAGSACLADTSKVLGLVTTNAMVYDTSAPLFDNGSLQYKVAGLHFGPDGKAPVIGTYDLVMRSDTARCLYGFTNAPLQASISIIGGTDQVATTVVSEKDGWLKLAAYGFTFSEKAISVKLTQTPAVTASAPANPSMGPRLKTITCIKGKVTKKLAQSKCPPGFKQKR